VIISYVGRRGSTWLNSTGALSRTLTSLGATANNLLIASLLKRASNDSPSVSTGWTLAGEAAGAGATHTVWYRIATGDSSDNITVTWGDSGEPQLTVWEYTGNATIDTQDSSIATKYTYGTTNKPGSLIPNSSAGAMISVLGNPDSLQWRSNGPFIDLGTRNDKVGGTSWDPLQSIALIPYTSTAAINPTWSTTDTGGAALAVQMCFKEPAVAGGIALSGNAESESKTTGTASFTIPMVGVSASITTANATITTGIPFAGGMVSVTEVDGNLSLSVGLQGSMLADAVASALLSSSSPLFGSAGSVADANATLSVGSGLAGFAGSESDADAALSVGADLAGYAGSDSEASADLSVGSGLAGAALSQALVNGGLNLSFSLDGATLSEALASAVLSLGSSVDLSGDMAAEASANSSALQMNIPMTGAVVSAADVDGVVTTIMPMAGGGASVTAMLGSLDIGIGFAGNANAEAIINSMLNFKFNLSADLVAQASASGLLSGAGDLVSDARYLSPFHSRDYVSQHKPRAWVSGFN